MKTMVTVSPNLLSRHLNTPLLKKAYSIIESDEETMELIKMANVMAVHRMMYNDHGIVHVRIVAGTALELLDLVLQAGQVPSTIHDRSAKNIDEAKLVVLLASYLHDIGNSIHRFNHEQIGAILAKDILDRVLPDILGYRGKRMIALRQEIMHIIYATEYHTNCLTLECSVVKIADGLDMSEGRARIPYKLGKVDMHAMSALSIKKVEIEKGERPIRIIVKMDDMAGLFQLEQVLMPKIRTSTIQDYIEIHMVLPDKTIKYYPRHE